MTLKGLWEGFALEEASLGTASLCESVLGIRLWELGISDRQNRCDERQAD